MSSFVFGIEFSVVDSPSHAIYEYGFVQSSSPVRQVTAVRVSALSLLRAPLLLVLPFRISVVPPFVGSLSDDTSRTH